MQIPIDDDMMLGVPHFRFANPEDICGDLYIRTRRPILPTSACPQPYRGIWPAVCGRDCGRSVCVVGVWCVRVCPALTRGYRQSNQSNLTLPTDRAAADCGCVCVSLTYISTLLYSFFSQICQDPRRPWVLIQHSLGQPEIPTGIADRF